MFIADAHTSAANKRTELTTAMKVIVGNVRAAYFGSDVDNVELMVTGFSPIIFQWYLRLSLDSNLLPNISAMYQLYQPRFVLGKFQT